MQVKCPRCQARSSLPAGKEGAKVRCGECGRIFVAHPPGEGVRQSGLGTSTIVGFGLGIAALFFFFLWRSAREADAPAPTARAAGPVDDGVQSFEELGWSSPAVRTAVRIHEAAYAYDDNALRHLLHGPRILAREGGAASYASLPQVARLAHQNRWIEDLTRGDGRAMIGEWRPYDGEVLEMVDGEATVRLSVSPQSDPTSVEKRWINWKLTRDGERWKAWSWERWFSPEELATAARREKKKGYEEVTLSDGSEVFEREPEPLEHLADTSPELRERIDTLYATMLDLDLTTEAGEAQHALVEIGRPAIPILLTGLYATPLDTEENAIKCNLVVQTLRRITGEHHGYKPQLLEGSGTGTSEERRQSAIKQWFAWWYQNQNKFTEKEAEDGLEGLIELTDKEQRWLERHQD